MVPVPFVVSNPAIVLILPILRILYILFFPVLSAYTHRRGKHALLLRAGDEGG